ncbi:MAG: FHA domain-containing protein [Cyanobacteria bacterium J06641_5]
MVKIELVHPLQEKVVQSWQFDLTQQTISIGRSRQNDVILMSAVVSRHHAVLHRDTTGWNLEPLGHNGCFIDDKPVGQKLLRNGQIFRIARTGPRLRLVLEANASETPQPQSTRQSTDAAAENPLSSRETFFG